MTDPPPDVRVLRAGANAFDALCSNSVSQLAERDIKTAPFRKLSTPARNCYNSQHVSADVAEVWTSVCFLKRPLVMSPTCINAEAAKAPSRSFSYLYITHLRAPFGPPVFLRRSARCFRRHCLARRKASSRICRRDIPFRCDDRSLGSCALRAAVSAFPLRCCVSLKEGDRVCKWRFA